MSNEEFRLLNFSLDNILDNITTSTLTSEQWKILSAKFKQGIEYAECSDRTSR